MIKISKVDNIDESSQYKLKRKKKLGIIVSIVSIGALVSGLASINNSTKDVQKINFSMPTSSNISSDEINDMNIIINDSDCSDKFFNDVCDVLIKDGIEFSTTKNCVDINKDNCTVITLDQQYSSGASTLIFAPYNNTRLGNSDSLAVAMKTAFDQNCFFVDNILCSQVGFEQDSLGNVRYNVATDTEKAIEDDKDASFVTISFGTTNNNAEWTAKSIENGLARQKYYLDNFDNGSDLVYCANQTDSIEDISKYFGVDATNLVKYNSIKDNKIADTQAIVNPNVESMDVFNKNYLFEIDNQKTRAY